MTGRTILTLLIIILLAVGIVYWAGTQPGVRGINATSTDTATNSSMLGGELGEVLPVNSATVQYFGTTTGYYARPGVAGEFPGVVMIHEWWGLNQNIKDMADQLAARGYQVLAVDLYGTVATTPDQARALTQGIDQSRANANMQAATDFLRSRGASKIASLGWCFGGGQSLQLALSGEELDATIIYYGQLATDQARLATLDQPVLGIFGAEDGSIPVASVNQFEAALEAAGVPHEIHIYPGVGHAFANPSGDNYAPAETFDAWEKTIRFLEQTLL